MASLQKILCAGFIAVFLGTAGIGCKGLSDSQKAAIAPVTLNYWTVYGNVPELQRLAGEYKKIRPYVTITVRQLRYEEFDTVFVNALADDAGPDIVSLHTRWLGKYANRLSSMPGNVTVANITIRGKYQPETVVTFETNRMPTLDAIERNYVSTVPEDVRVGGQIYGLPLSVDALALYYNKDLLDKAGVPLPPATWTEFLDAVKKATKFDSKGAIVQAGAAIGTGANIDNSFDILSLLMLQNGVTMARGSRVAFAEGLDRASAAHPTLEALRFYTDFARPTKEVYAWNGEFGKALDEFTRGKAVFFLGFGYDLARIRARAPQMNVGIAPIPQLNPSVPVNVANYWVESVVKKSPDQDEAWDFLRFISTPSTLKAYSELQNQPSPLRSHIAAQLELPLLAPFASQVLTAANWYHGRDIDAASRALQNLIDRYLEPLGENEDGTLLERDLRLINTTASIIQQTM